MYRTSKLLLIGLFGAGLCAAACGGSSESEPASVPMESDTATGGETPEATATVSPTPEGYQSVQAMLVVPDLEAAMGFYETALGAERGELARGPDGTPLHGEIRIGDSVVMLSPENEEHGNFAPATTGGTNGGLLVYVEDVDAAFAAAIEAGAEQVTPVADMFWGDRYGQLSDPYGHRWSLATHRFDLSDEEMGRRAQAWAAAMAEGDDPPEFEPGEPAQSFTPEGWHTITPSLVVSDGDAIDFFVQALGAEEVNRTETPDGNLMHAEVRIGNSIVMLSGEDPEHDAHMKTPAHMEGRAPMSLYVYVDDVDATFAQAIGAGATEEIAVTDMFWGDRFGQLRTPSRNAIGIATHVEDVTPEQMEERMRSQAPAAEASAGEASAESDDDRATEDASDEQPADESD